MEDSADEDIGLGAWRPRRRPPPLPAPPAALPPPQPSSSRRGSSGANAPGGTAWHRAVPLVQALREVHEDLRAYLFLFVEVACVGSCAAACRPLRSCLWADSTFWRTYGGPCLLALSPTSPAPLLRDVFRRWLFRLDAPSWAEDLRRAAEAARSTEFGADFTRLLTDAKYVASGLMPGDSGPAVGEFVELVCSLLSEYDPTQLDERSLAEALVMQVELREDVFTAEQAAAVAAAYDCSMDRALLAESADDIPEGGHFMGPLEDESEEEGEGALGLLSRLGAPGEGPSLPTGGFGADGAASVFVDHRHVEPVT